MKKTIMIGAALMLIAGAASASERSQNNPFQEIWDEIKNIKEQIADIQVSPETQGAVRKVYSGIVPDDYRDADLVITRTGEDPDYLYLQSVEIPELDSVDMPLATFYIKKGSADGLSETVWDNSDGFTYMQDGKLLIAFASARNYDISQMDYFTPAGKEYRVVVIK